MLPNIRRGESLESLWGVPELAAAVQCVYDVDRRKRRQGRHDCRFRDLSRVEGVTKELWRCEESHLTSVGVRSVGGLFTEEERNLGKSCLICTVSKWAEWQERMKRQKQRFYVVPVKAGGTCLQQYSSTGLGSKRSVIARIYSEKRRHQAGGSGVKVVGRRG